MVTPLTELAIRKKIMSFGGGIYMHAGGVGDLFNFGHISFKIHMDTP